MTPERLGSLHISIDEPTKRLAKRLAKQDERSAASLIRFLLKQEARRRGLVPERTPELVRVPDKS